MANSNLNLTLQATLNGSPGSNGADVNDDLIERYVRFEETLDRATVKRIGEYVENRLNVKAVEQFYRQFYEEYDGLESRLAPRVEAFVASLFE